MHFMKPVLANRHFILIAVVLLMTWGIVSFVTIPRSEDPQLDFSGSSVLVVLPGASPEEIEKLVVDPIEEAINETGSILHLLSSSGENVALITVEFNVDSDPDEKHREVVSAIDNIRNSLPAGINRLDITKFSSSDVAILQYAFVCATADYRELTENAKALKKKLQRISGIDKVEILGYPERRFDITIAPEKLEAAGISIDRIAEALTASNRSVPGGSIVADGKKFSVRVNSELRTADDIAATIVGAWNGGNAIRLGDIARITLEDADTLYRARYNRETALFLTVSQQKGTNIFPIARAVKMAVAGFRPVGPAPVRIEMVFDQSHSVDVRLGGFFVNILQGMALVSLVMLLTLGFRAATIIALVIPLSILTAIAVLDLCGFGLDQISIIALAIALGMLVDNAIVVLELVSRKKMAGESGNDAALHSISEIGWAVVNSTVTTVIAFLPLAFLHSHVGNFIRGLPLTVIFALTASLLFALTVTPLMAGRYLGVRSRGTAAGGMRNGLYDIAENGYRHALERLLKRPAAVLVAAIIFFAGTLCLLLYVKVSLFPGAEKPHLFISFETPKGTSLQRTDSVAAAIERILDQQQGVTDYATNIGKGNPRIYYNMFALWESTNIGQIFVSLDGGRETYVASIIDSLRKKCASIPAAKIHVQGLVQGMPVAAPVAIRIFGDNLDSIKLFSNAVEAVITATPGAVNVRNPGRETRTDVHIGIDRAKAALAGVAPVMAAQEIRTAVLGRTATILRDEKGDEYPVVLHTGASSAPSMQEIEQVTIPSISGDKVPLRQIAGFTFEQSPSIINHYHLERAITVLADVRSGFNTAQITAEVRKSLESARLPKGVTWKVAGEEESRNESFAGITKALAVALIGIFAVLVLQFRNFSQPFIVFTAIPFAISGSILALLITGYSFSFTAFIGLTSLMGIVVNNSIILVDCANQLRASGMSLLDASINACTQRFTPILLTTITTMLGLVPLLLSGSSLWAPLSWVITGGMAVSTLLTLFVVPALYLLYTRKARGDKAGV